MKKYGKFYMKDYIWGWVASGVFITVIVFGVYANISVALLVMPMLFAIYFPVSIIIPNLESFFIDDDVICVKKANKKCKLSIPKNCSIIVAYADFCPLFAEKLNSGNHTYMLKGRYSISIVSGDSLEFIFNKLHSNYAKKYTTSSVEEKFKMNADLIYSFVCDNDLLNELIKNRTCQIIIPESLKSDVKLNNTASANIIYDKGF